MLARAPTRIDLAGGTLDIYPLYLLEGEGLTVNLAIDVWSEAQVLPRPQGGVELVSLDTGSSLEAARAEDLRPEGDLELLVRAIRLLGRGRSLSIRTRSHAPRGSGLGASSALLVVLLQALTGGNLLADDLVRLAQDLETQTLRVPTGRQDHHAAVRGGVNAIWFGVGPDRVEPLSEDPAWLEETLVLCYTGVSRASAVTNWRMFRAYVDGHPRARQALGRIGQVARGMRQAILDRDVAAVGDLLAQEWEHRLRLALGVSSPRVDSLVGAARNAGALAAKLCGAGGGGCLAVVVPPGRRRAVELALEAAGAVVMPFRVAREGLRTLPEDALLL